MSIYPTPETVLVVDTDAAVRRLIADALRIYGYHVLVAASGQQAEEILVAGNPVDLLVADVLAGSEALTSHFPRIPVLYMMAFQAGRAPVSRRYVLIKPFTISSLLAQVRAALNEVNIVTDTGCASLVTNGTPR